MTASLRVHDLHARFGDSPGLRGIDLAVEPGERLVIVGASGAGKSTLLRAIAGLAPVAAGRVEIGGREVTRLPPERRDTVYLHQTPLLFPHLSVGENVAFPLRVRRTPDAEVRARVAHLLARVGLEGFAARPPRTLSGGQRHRVALARALAAGPALLLLDEPLSSLDPALREEVRGTIVALQAEGRPGIVLVTHDLDEAGLLGDRVGVLLEGRIAQLAPPAELFARPASLAVARFLGFPNRLPGRVRADGCFECTLGAWTPPGDPRPPGPAVAVFRADAVRVMGEGEEGTMCGRVVALRSRVGGTTASVRVEDGEVEVAMDSLHPPPTGACLSLTVLPERICIFADPERTNT